METEDTFYELFCRIVLFLVVAGIVGHILARLW